MEEQLDDKNETIVHLRSEVSSEASGCTMQDTPDAWEFPPEEFPHVGIEMLFVFFPPHFSQVRCLKKGLEEFAVKERALRSQKEKVSSFSGRTLVTYKSTPNEAKSLHFQFNIA